MKITYLDKVAIQNDDSIPDINKVTDKDMNEIKKVVNSNEDNQKEIQIENERLRADLNGLPKGQAEGEKIDLTDSADMRFSSFKISGNSKQDGEPTPDTPIEVKSCGDNGSINEIIENEDKTQSQVFTIPTQQPMRSIGDVRDTFVKVNGKWFERHNTDRVIFNGTESWQNVNGYGIFYINNINNLKHNTSAEILMGCASNCFNEITTSEINAKKEGFCVATVNRLYFFHNGFSSNENLEGFKAWLQEQHNAGTPVYVDYILVTPNDIECTTEQIAKLNELNSTAKTYKGTTHFYSTDNVGANKEVRYFKDIEIMMNK